MALTEVLGFAANSSVQTLKKVSEFDLPGPPGKRFDYLTITPDDHYLLSAHLAARLYVIDLRVNKVVATVTDTPGAEGVEYVPGSKKAYSSNAGDNTIGVLDLRQMKVIKKNHTEAKPDGSAYAAPFHKLYVSDERGKAEAIVDVRTDEVIKTLRFDSETGMPQYDPVAKKEYVNLQDQNIFANIDPARDEVVGPGLKRIYMACSSGAISVFQMDDPDHYRKLEDFPVQKKVHSLAVDTESHRVYGPEQEADGKGDLELIEVRISDGKQLLGVLKAVEEIRQERCPSGMVTPAAFAAGRK